MATLEQYNEQAKKEGKEGSLGRGQDITYTGADPSGHQETRYYKENNQPPWLFIAVSVLAICLLVISVLATYIAMSRKKTNK